MAARSFAGRAFFSAERSLARGVLNLPGSALSFIGRRRSAPIDGRTLDRQVAALLEMDRIRGTLDVTRETVASVRRKMATSLALLDLDPDPSVDVHPISIAGMAARSYTPQGIGAVSPVVVYFHGGGLVTGNLETCDGFCRRVAARGGLRVISVEYRLAPEHPFPAAPDDATAAFKDVFARAHELHADRGRLAVMGDSAGATLSATVCQRTAHADARPALQVLIYPATDLTRSFLTHQLLGDGYLLTRSMIDWFLNHYFANGGDRRDPEASPLFREDVSGSAPALVYTAGFDPLRAEGKAYADRLQAVGRLVRHLEFEALPHGFTQLAGLVDAARSAVDTIIDDTAAALRRPSPQ